MTRDEFEKWLETDEGVSRFGMELTDAYKHFAWEGWQAGYAAASKPVSLSYKSDRARTVGSEMTRDDIIRMAREAGAAKVLDAVVFDREEQLASFSELVAAAERERLNKKIAALESDVDHFFKLSGEYLERANKAEEAVALERERCAKVCEAYADKSLEKHREDWTKTAAICAALIRGTK